MYLSVIYYKYLIIKYLVLLHTSNQAIQKAFRQKITIIAIVLI